MSSTAAGKLYFQLSWRRRGYPRSSEGDKAVKMLSRLLRNTRKYHKYLIANHLKKFLDWLICWGLGLPSES